jgi:hypothetical protein
LVSMACARFLGGRLARHESCLPLRPSPNGHHRQQGDATGSRSRPSPRPPSAPTSFLLGPPADRPFFASQGSTRFSAPPHTKGPGLAGKAPRNRRRRPLTFSALSRPAAVPAGRARREGVGGPAGRPMPMADVVKKMGRRERLATSSARPR